MHAADAVGGALGHLQIVVGETEQRHRPASRRERSRHIGWTGSPREASTRPRAEGSAARPWSAYPAFSTMWRCGPSVRMGWPLPCFTFSQRIRPPLIDKREEQRRHHRAAGTERQILEQPEEGELVGVREKREIIEHALRTSRFQRVDNHRHLAAERSFDQNRVAMLQRRRQQRSELGGCLRA